MTPNEKIKIREMIESKISRLEKNIAELKELTQPIAPDSAIGRVSRMDAINNRSINEAALRKKKVQLVKLQEALKQIDEPEFGVCIKCKASIQPQRIILMPESRVCVKCAN
jgi:DnaK suppressor protein